MNETLEPLTFSHRAMGTVFQIFVRSSDPHYAGQAAQAAFTEVDRLEQDLSRFLPNSDIARIRALAPGQWLPVGADTFACLEECRRLFSETDGLFDVTIGPLMDCWLAPDKTLRSPSSEELAAARARVGMDKLHLNKNRISVAVAVTGLIVDLGGYGKGYAVDRMAEVLCEWDVTDALIHAGASSVRALDGVWPVTVSEPGQGGRVLQTVHLHQAALNGSGVEKGQHILNPRTGRPEVKNRAAWSFMPRAAYGDALSTAFMLMGEHEIAAFCKRHPDVGALILPASKPSEVLTFGAWPVNLSKKGIRS